VLAELITAVLSPGPSPDHPAPTPFSHSDLLEEPSPTEEATLRKINIGGPAGWC
jgi:hypothetical protein